MLLLVLPKEPNILHHTLRRRRYSYYYYDGMRSLLWRNRQGTVYLGRRGPPLDLSTARPHKPGGSYYLRRRNVTTSTLSRIALAANDSDDHKEVVTNSLRPFYQSQTPVILQNYAQSWPAVAKWQDFDYLKRRLGDGSDEEWHCDVEMGAYNAGGGGEGFGESMEQQQQRLSIPFSSYIDYLSLWQKMDAEEQEQNPILYLAQNDLPAALYSDIVLPPFLNTHHISDSKGSVIFKQETSSDDDAVFLGDGKLYQCMFWMGPPTAESPLHYDPLHNILVQVVGTKRVALVDRNTPRDVLYAGGQHGQQENTSALPMRPLLLQKEDKNDVDINVMEKYPKAESLSCLTGMLHPGDALYIPAKWWHHVESLDFTTSVNVWWR